MSDPADAARRQRAEQAARHERAKAWMTERVARKGSSFSCLDIIDAHRAGAREEAAIKDAEIAALRKSANEWALMAGKNHLEVKALREAVRDASVVLRYKGFNVVAWALRVPAVRRALEEKP